METSKLTTIVKSHHCGKLTSSNITVNLLTTIPLELRTENLQFWIFRLLVFTAWIEYISTPASVCSPLLVDCYWRLELSTVYLLLALLEIKTMESEIGKNAPSQQHAPLTTPTPSSKSYASIVSPTVIFPSTPPKPHPNALVFIVLIAMYLEKLVVSCDIWDIFGAKNLIREWRVTVNRKSLTAICAVKWL